MDVLDRKPLQGELRSKRAATDAIAQRLSKARDTAPAWTVEPTPVSLRRERAEAERLRLGQEARETPRPAGGSSPSLPRPARDSLSPDELAEIQEQSQARVVRPAPKRDHPSVTEYLRAVYLDERGEPCACNEYGACALHLALDGRRRHDRP